MRALLVLLATQGLLACAGDRPASPAPDASVDAPAPAPDAADDVAADEPAAPDVAATVTVTFRLIDAVTQRGVVGRIAPGAGGESVELADGEASLDLPAGRPFEVVAEAAGYAPIHLHGLTGDTAFTLISFAASRTVARSVFRALGLTDDGTTGLVVAGLDTPSLRPAVGAAARIEGLATPGFIFDAAGMPRAGNTLLAGGASFVSLPGVAPGPATVRVTAPTGQRCGLREGGGDTAALTVQAGAIHVLSFICAPPR